MQYRILADIVVLFHFCFIVFAVFGGFLVLKGKWWVWIHVPAVLYSALIEFFGWICPLTPLENCLRKAYGLSGYETGFIDHYIVPVIYPSSITQGMQIALGFFVLTINLCVYGWIWYLRTSIRRCRRKKSCNLKNKRKI